MTRIRTAAPIALALALASATAASAYPGQALASHAKISLARARTIALHARPGTIVGEELETEPGGSGLRFSFDVKSARGLREVGVDAKTGAVLENAVDEPDPAPPKTK